MSEGDGSERERERERVFAVVIVTRKYLVPVGIASKKYLKVVVQRERETV